MKTAVLLASVVALFSCAQQGVHTSLTDRELVERLVGQKIDPCRVYPCTYSGRTQVEVVNVPPEDRGDFIVFPHKEVVIVRPADALPPFEKVEKGRCR